MKYALGNIEMLIQTDLNPAVIKLKQPPNELLTEYLHRITEEKSLIRTVLIEEVFSLKKEKSVELLIQHYQSALIYLADDTIQAIQLIESFQPDTPGEELSVIKVYRHTIKCLEELLTFIEKHFNRYFNINEKIPESYKLLMQSNFRNTSRVILEQYKNTGIDSGLLELIMSPFQNFIKANNSRQVTYRELFYLKTLQVEFSEILTSNPNTITTKTMVDLLLYLNFNNYYFINYYIDIISRDVNAVESISLQVEKLAWWLKTISHIQTRPVIAYNLDVPSAKDQLISWLVDEISFLEKKHQLTLVVPPQLESIPKSIFSVVTTLSVKQAALLTRLLIDTGIIKTDNQTELLTKLAGVLKTERKESISPQNLRARDYNIEEPSKSILNDWLIKMINQLRKY